MTTKTDNHAEEQAAAQYSSIVRMLAALACDYDRLTELKDEREELTEAVKNAEAANAERPADWSALAEKAARLNHYDKTGELELPVVQAVIDAKQNLTQWEADNAEELAELEDAAGECTDEDEARQIIQEDPLEVQVRSDWTNPGDPLEAGEFMILLCTGGPAVRIVGELNRGEPCRAWLEYQDWGTGWTQWFGASSDTLCKYAANFFFGE